MSAEEEMNMLLEKIRLLESQQAQRDATINELKEKMEAEQQCVSEHSFTLEMECPGENEEVPNGRIAKSEDIELEGVKVEVLSTVSLNSQGEHQVEVWPKISSDSSYNLTLFTELQLASKNAQSSYNKPISFGLQSELIRIDPDMELNCTRRIVPEWNQKYAVQCRGQSIQLRCRVKIVRGFKPIQKEDGVGREEIEIAGKKIRVNLAYLSEWSNEFKNGVHSRSRLINVGSFDVSEDDFEEMLDVIYPTSKPITHWNVEKMLAIAQKLKMPELIRRCEIFLNESSKHNLSEIQTLFLADKYGLQAIKTIVLERFSTTETLRSKVIKREEYSQLTPEMRRNIDSRYVELDLEEKNVVEAK
ncbi:hypothetical protein PMAYCL1PPCAC_32063 [Pristionchus mayeri]|uniref:BTB domain-containing protein n=1 Tax=Pristionchus mayeri TaxID=1317129 RepID=A0AAN5DES9_9BILA|nr:hypothetical protein PMAYCL1PPCAC_32063 [Pristionchus mayeri]